MLTMCNAKHKETVQDYLANEKRVHTYIASGFMFWALSGVPYVLFSNHKNWQILGMAVCVVFGIIAIVVGAFTEKEDYKVLKQESLRIEYEFLKELSAEYYIVKKKYEWIAIPCAILYVVGILAILLTLKDVIMWSEYHVFIFLGFAIGIYGFIKYIGTMEAYALLIKNEQYCNRFWFKIKRIIRRKFDSI